MIDELPATHGAVRADRSCDGGAGVPRLKAPGPFAHRLASGAGTAIDDLANERPTTRGQLRHGTSGTTCPIDRLLPVAAACKRDAVCQFVDACDPAIVAALGVNRRTALQEIWR